MGPAPFSPAGPLHPHPLYGCLQDAASTKIVLLGLSLAVGARRSFASRISKCGESQFISLSISFSLNTTIDANMSLRIAILVVAAFVFPPLPVFLLLGVSPQLLVSLILSLAGHLPGVVYALYVVHQDTVHARRVRDIEQVVSPLEEPLLDQRDPQTSSGDKLGGKSVPKQSNKQLSTPLVSSEGSSTPSETPQGPPAYETVVGDNKIQF